MLIARIDIAKRFDQRLIGLLGSKTISEDYGMFFPQCNSIHSYLMRTKFDAVFCDQGMRVRAVYTAVAPGRIISCPSATGCLEIAPDRAQALGIRVGMDLQLVD